MKKLLFLSAFLVGALCSFVTRPRFTGTAVYLGDSKTFGNQLSHDSVGGNTANHQYCCRWTKLYSDAHGYGENNYGVSGGTLLNYAPYAGNSPLMDWKSSVDAYDGTQPKIFISYTFNEYYRGLAAGKTTTEFINAYKGGLDTVINYLVTTKGWPLNKIVVLAEYANAPAYSVTETGMQVVSDSLKAYSSRKGNTFASFCDYWMSRSDRAEFSHDLINGGADGIHEMEWANSLEAGALDSLMGAAPTPPANIVKYGVISKIQ